MICIGTSCIDLCICLNYSINCQGKSSITKERLFWILSNFVFINISNQLPNDNIKKLHNTIILTAKNNNLLVPLFCDISCADIKLRVMDLSFNKILKLDKNNFVCLPELNEIILNHNGIKQIKDSVFKTLTKLKSLDLSSNRISSLHKCAFCGLDGLLLLSIIDNNIIYVHNSALSEVKVHLILTDDFQICCMISWVSSLCTAKPTWPSSCNNLLSTFSLKMAAWSFGILIILCNLISVCNMLIAWFKVKVFKDYKTFVMVINFCDLAFGLYLVTLAIKDLLVERNYIEVDLSWRSSIICHALSFISFLAILISSVFLMVVSISRYRVIKYPFEKPFGRKSLIIVKVYLPV